MRIFIYGLILAVLPFAGMIQPQPEPEYFDHFAQWLEAHPWRIENSIEVMPVFSNPFHQIPAAYAQREGLTLNALSHDDMYRIAVEFINNMGLELKCRHQPIFY